MDTLASYLYILATVGFIFGIKRLSGVRSARSGNQIAAIGMLIATVGVLVQVGALSWPVAIAGLVIGSGIGIYLARSVEMTAMPELVAAFNGLGGAASAFVGLAFIVQSASGDLPEGIESAALFDRISKQSAITLPISILVGVATLTGSLVAYLKLSGKKLVHPLGGSIRHSAHAALGLFLLTTSFWLVAFADGPGSITMAAIALVLVSGLLGIFLVLPIGGADMPVVVALLNSYSGVAAAASGFVLNNLLLVVAGALVGASGLILTQIMCKAMNRSLGNVLLGGIGDDAVAEDAREYTGVKETSPEEVAMLLDGASNVIVVPGYGLAVAQAQHVVRELSELLGKRGVTVRFAIHPVAGRMPGHMNVLLAEADVPYEQLFELERINGDIQEH